MAAKDINLYGLFAELNKLGQNGEYERALKTANRILGLSQEDESALHCKVVCFVQLSRFNDALQLITKHPKFALKVEFEKAYCLYRLNRNVEALKIVENVSNPPLNIMELKAQILYRLDQFEKCFSVYKDIIKNFNNDYQDEHETNLSAAIVNLVIEGSSMDIPPIREDTYELIYNAACKMVASAGTDKSLLLEAEKKLRSAEKMCRNSLEEDGMTEEEMEEELGPIKIQLGYCLQLQGREKEAQALYIAALKAKPNDIALIATASNNLVTLNKDQNVFDSKKRMKNATHEGLEHKLTSRQKESIAFNHCLLAAYTSQGEQCRQICDKLAKDHPKSTPKAMLVKAYQLSKENKALEAAELLQKFAPKDNALPMKLAAVQILLGQGQKKEAIEVLKSFNEKERYLPGIVSALVTLHMADNDREQASSILKDAVNYYKKNKENTGNLGTLWRHAADFHLRGGEVKVAAASLEELLAASPSDRKTLAQLVIAYAQFDPAKAQALSKRLPPLQHLSETTDVDALESNNWIIGTKVVKRKVEPSPGQPSAESVEKKKKKRKRKPRLPKNFDPSVLPDPERWLPKHERSGYRKKRDRRNRDAAMKGTQGAAAGASDQYDITKMASNTKPSPNLKQSPAVESSGPRQQQRRVQQKKKKKGGKW